MERSGKRDGDSYMLRFTLCVFLAINLLMLVPTVYAQCDQQSLLTANTTFSKTNLRCQTSLSQGAWSQLINGTDMIEIVYISPLSTQNWVGLGFSSNGKMGGSVGLLATIPGSSGPNASWYNLGSDGIDGPVPGSSYSTQLTVQHNSGSVYVSVVVNISTILPGKTPISLLFAHGPLDPTTAFPQKHDQRTSEVANFAPAGTHLSLSDTTKVAHGALNLIGWGILLPIGAIIARYCKQWDPTWFYLHISFQSLGFILIIAGLVTGFSLQDSYQGLSGLDSHRALAVVVFILAILQMLAILLRPKKDAKIRRYWNWYHHWVGRSALILAAANLFVGAHIAKEGGVTAGYGIILGLETATIVVLEAIFCIRGRNKAHGSPNMSPNFAPNFNNEV